MHHYPKMVSIHPLLQSCVFTVYSVMVVCVYSGHTHSAESANCKEHPLRFIALRFFYIASTNYKGKSVLKE